MDTCRVPGPLWTVLFTKKLFLLLQPELKETDPPPSLQLPSPNGRVPTCHPDGRKVPLKFVVTEHCWTGLHWYWTATACCQKVALAFWLFRYNPHSRVWAPPKKL